MVAVAPVWAHIFQMDLASQYDWIIHVEPDHFINAKKVRLNVVQNPDALRTGGIWARRLWRHLFGTDSESKIVIVGLNNAGKTTILYKLHLGQVVLTQPTIGSNVEEVKHDNLTFTVWDLGGDPPSKQLGHLRRGHRCDYLRGCKQRCGREACMLAGACEQAGHPGLPDGRRLLGIWL